MNKKLLITFKEYLVMTVAMSVYVFGWTAFLIPNQIPGGGVTGFSSIINYAFGIPVSYTYTIANIILLVAGTLILGKGFGIKTIYCIAVSSLMFEFFPLIPWTSDIPDKLLNAIIGGAFSGIGSSLVFTQGGSTGGVDIIALGINKYKEVAPGKIYMVCDALIITSILLLPGKALQDVVYGYVTIAAFTYMIDLVLTGSKQSVQILVISRNYREIADKLNVLDKGVTAINSVGWYSKKEAMILLVVTRKNEMHDVMRAIKETDHHAFLTVTGVMGVYGEGFEQIKG